MRFPHALKGIKIIHTAELVTLMLNLTSLGLLIVEQLVDDAKVLDPFYWVVLALGLLALALELVGIVTAAKDEPLFRTASIGMVLTLLLSFGVLFISEGELLRSLLELVCIIPTIYCSTTVIQGIMRLAEKVGDRVLPARRAFIISTVILLSVGAIGLEFVVSVFLHGEKYEVLHGILHTMILTMELMELNVFIGCTGQAEKLLHHAGAEHG